MTSAHHSSETRRPIPRGWSIAAGIVVIMISLGGCQHAPQSSVESAWSELATDVGELSVPAGWNVRFFAAPGAAPWIFWLAPRSKAFIVVVIGVDFEDASERDLDAWLMDFNEDASPQGSPRQIRTVEVPGGRVHCSINSGPKSYSACVMWPRGKARDLAVVHVVGADRRKLEALGGLGLLVQIASSAENFVAEPVMPRRTP